MFWVLEEVGKAAQRLGGIGAGKEKQEKIEGGRSGDQRQRRAVQSQQVGKVATLVLPPLPAGAGQSQHRQQQVCHSHGGAAEDQHYPKRGKGRRQPSAAQGRAGGQTKEQAGQQQNAHQPHRGVGEGEAGQRAEQNEIEEDKDAAGIAAAADGVPDHGADGPPQHAVNQAGEE